MKRLFKCRCDTRRFCIGCFMFTGSFPIEHLLWENVWPLNLVLPLLGVH